METFDFLIKFIVIGDSGVGKSCILHRFIDEKFFDDGSTSSTIGVEFGSKVMSFSGHNIKLQIWDTAGQERYRAVTRSYYRGAAGALLVYDLTSRETFNSVRVWLDDARSLASQELVVLLVGNKGDLDAQREVPFLEASAFAQENGLMFLETSAKTGANVEEVFLKCARAIYSKVEQGVVDPRDSSSGVQVADARFLSGSSSGSASDAAGCNC